VDPSNALYVVLAVLLSLVLADLVLMGIFGLMDLADPGRLEHSWASLSNWVGRRLYDASDLRSHATRSKG
jgi:hypothetical protein